MINQNWDNDKNLIFTIKFRDIEFEIDLIEELLLIEPSIKDHFKDNRGKISNKTFDKQPLNKFLKRLSDMWFKQNAFESFETFLIEQEKLK